jgi:hypothetical protein
MRARLSFPITLFALAAPAVFAPFARAETASQLYYERAVMSAAGARCGLFNPSIAAALAAAQVQARNTALRAGAAPAELDAALGRANARAWAAACGGPDVQTAAERVRQAFKAYAGLHAMTYPGDLGDWRAVRDQTVVNNAWRLSQTSRAGGDVVMFGLSGRQGQDALTAVAAFPDGAIPYAARLVLRDPARAPGPYIVDLSGKAPLSERLPPAVATRAILAETRTAAELTLLPPGARAATAFRFPAYAVAALAGLDPRESVGVDFVFAGPSGEAVRRAYFEVGDFSAGVAFLRVAQR